MKKLPIISIVGRANVGKSSIFNTLLRTREAIVAKEAGTTRDSIMGKVSYRDQDFWIVDTAGMKDPVDDFEATIQEQIAQALDSSEVICVVIEADTIITNEDRQVAKLALKSKKPVVLIVNKIDRVKKFEIEDYQKLGIKTILPTSTTQTRGFDDLLEELSNLIPKTRDRDEDDIIRIAIIGRPNVGKSQLFNSLLQKQQAVVADRAGTTRDVNKVSVRYEGKQIQLMDTAGIRRSGKIGQGIEHFSVIRTLSAIESSDICLLLIDVNEINVQLDQKIAGMVKDSNKGLIIVVSKWDSRDEDTPYMHDELIPKIKYEYQFVPWAPVVFTSAITGQNVTKLLALSLEIFNSRNRKIKTSELNKWLKNTLAKHPPAGLKNTNPKLNYMIQEDDNTSPNFKIYGSHTRYLHWSYKRFLERELREKYDFDGTAIKLWFFEKHVDRLKKTTKQPHYRKS
ncbi:MAG TPA: ribosome biogenesis GTPase Der [Candidatus Saccharimonadales bacterium]|jgi:GTP-binding protein|nr:ribosome biogenesis GTPase Der [Candidatus Saccharimonadales bacterium]